MCWSTLCNVSRTSKCGKRLNPSLCFAAGSEPEPQLAAEAAAAAATEGKLMPEAFEKCLSDDDEQVGGVE